MGQAVKQFNVLAPCRVDVKVRVKILHLGIFARGKVFIILRQLKLSDIDVGPIAEGQALTDKFLFAEMTIGARNMLSS